MHHACLQSLLCGTCGTVMISVPRHSCDEHSESESVASNADLVTYHCPDTSWNVSVLQMLIRLAERPDRSYFTVCSMYLLHFPHLRTGSSENLLRQLYYKYGVNRSPTLGLMQAGLALTVVQSRCNNPRPLEDKTRQ